MSNAKTLFVFMDESGDMQFKPKGTTHFLVTAVCTPIPTVSAAKMQELKYDLMASRSEDLEFHATVNSKGTRSRVLNVISEIEGIKVHTLWIDKRYTYPSCQNSIALFGIFAKAMGRWIDQVYRRSDFEQVILVFDSVLTGKERDAFQKNIKPVLKDLKFEYKVLFHPVKQDLNGQIADYFSWAWFRMLENQDTTAFDALSDNHDWTQFDLFNSRRQIYWAGPKK
ncbi:DUF3800 domain-containing protein [Corynebacterium lactis]|uniref:DUF3800 domain-containing protein n=1 Tax=Corynebacterium lactis RW2-5 TaxID=1408189 RepID=A0A0K2H2A2_9CORY|nr:DUF3800 domain-containing protein [Corynebacterium lactis]ALA68164.1 hypothetical protein CLAC_11310 [Corynebacterium lactis RW2-5]